MHDIEVVDAQVHVASLGAPPPALTVHSLLDTMNKHSINRAVLTARTRVDKDNDYLLRSAAIDPTRFAVVGVLPSAGSSVDERMNLFSSHPSLLALRIVVITPEQVEAWNTGVHLRVFESAAQHGVPVCLWTPGRLKEIRPVADKYPNLRLILDHIGLPRTTKLVRQDNPPFRRLPDLLELAQYPNIAVKLTAAHTLSSEPYPFEDLWPSLHEIISSFGVDRVMWGSDWLSGAQDLARPYKECVDYIRETSELSATEKRAILGQTLLAILGWPNAPNNP